MMPNFLVKALVGIRVVGARGEAIDPNDYGASALHKYLLELCPSAEYVTESSGLYQFSVKVDGSSPLDAVLNGTSLIREAGHRVGAEAKGLAGSHSIEIWMSELGVEARAVDEEQVTRSAEELLTC
jgi:hypothetical protein